MRAVVLFLVGALLVLSAGCVETSPSSPPPGTSTDAAIEGFRASVIDANRTGYEPAITIAPDGSVWVCSLHGVGSGTDLWMSPDGTTPFRYIGTPLPDDSLPRKLPTLRSGAGDVGGGDCDVSVDAGGRVYLVDLWAGGVSISSSADQGATWRGGPVSIPVAPLDRPWVLGGEKDEVFVTAVQGQATGADQYGLPMPPAGGIWVSRSTDGGVTFPNPVLAVGNQDRLGLNSNLALDSEHLYVVYSKKLGEGKLAMMIAVSNDRGASWQQNVIAEQSYFPNQCFAPFNIFPSVAADGAGGVYAAWVLINPETNRQDLFMAASKDSGATWNKPVMVTDRPGTRAFPWIASDASGSVGLAWFETNITSLLKTGDVGRCVEDPPANGPWYLHYAHTTDALVDALPFTETLVQPMPTHNGTLARPYAEVLQLRFTSDGRAATAYVADVPEGAARPMFAMQEK